MALKAEQFCLNCHVKARVGDVLGTVTVRSDLARKETLWWQEVRLTMGALSLKILVHTIVLFWLLKVRMAPLLTLSGTLSGLARGVMDLSPRAAVNSADEFGELARDLNHFLDRIGVVVTDLDRILTEVVTVGARLGELNRSLEQQVDSVRDASLSLLGEGAQRSLETQLLAAREAGSVQALQQTVMQTLAALESGAPLPPGAAAALRDQLARLQQSFDAVSSALRGVVPPVVVGQAQSAEYQAFMASLRQMALLEATMQKVAEAGQQVLQRLAHHLSPAQTSRVLEVGCASGNNLAILGSMRPIQGLGIDTHGIDPGNDEEFLSNTILLQDGRVHLENLAGLDQMPARGGWIVIGGMRNQGGSGSPATIYGFIP